MKILKVHDKICNCKRKKWIAGAGRSIPAFFLCALLSVSLAACSSQGSQNLSESPSKQQEGSSSASSEQEGSASSEQQEGSSSASSEQEGSASSEQQEGSSSASSEQEGSASSEQQEGSSSASSQQTDSASASDQQQDSSSASGQQQDSASASGQQQDSSNASDQQQDSSNASGQQTDSTGSPSTESEGTDQEPILDANASDEELLAVLKDDIHVVADGEFNETATGILENTAEYAGQIYQLEGVLTMDGETPYLAHSTEEGEPRLPLKYLKSSFKEGEKVRITGIANQDEEDSAAVLEVIVAESL